MKKILLMASLLAFGQAVQAQSLRPSYVPALRSAQENPVTGTVSADNTEVAVLFTEDFATGLTTGWLSLGYSFSNNTAVHDTTGVWEYRGTATTPTRATGSRGAYGSAAPLASPSTANGFMIFDSDWLDNAGAAGTTNGIFNSPHRGMLVSPTINLTGNNFVNLEFYQYYRRFAGPGASQTVPATYVLFSIDGGTTWSDTIMLNSGIAVNAATTNPSLQRINVSNEIGNAANAKIAFLFNGDYYTWMIDDVKITEIPNNDLTVSSTVMLPDTANGRTLEYGTLPIQNKTPLTFQARIRNNGKVAQNNVRLNVTVADTSGNTLFTGQSAQLASLAAFTDTLLSVTTNYPATTVVYSRVTFSTLSDSTDEVPGDNQFVRQLSVTDSVMSPAVAVPASQGFLGTSQFTGSVDVSLASLFEIVNQDTVTSTTVRLNVGGTGGTQAGSLVQFSIRTPNPADGLPGDLSTIVVESDIYTISQEDVDLGFIRVDFPAELGGLPQNRILAPGDYWLQADLYSNNGTTRVRFLDDLTFTQPWFTSVLYTSQWYNNGNALRMSLNMADAVAGGGQSVQNLQKDLKINVYPNPAQNFLNVAVSADDRLGRISYEVLDITGRMVSSEATVINGNNEVLAVNLAGIQNGVYSIVVKTSKGYNTSRFVVAQ